MDVFEAIGKDHDFKIFKDSNVSFFPETTILADSGYQGMQKLHENTILPVKKSKNKELTTIEKEHNKNLAKTRVKVEHVFAWLKRFKILVNKCRKSISRLMYLRFKLFCSLFNNTNSKALVD